MEGTGPRVDQQQLHVTRILRTVYLGYDRVGLFSIDRVIDLVPVDMCVNAMITVAWETARSEHR